MLILAGLPRRQHLTKNYQVRPKRFLPEDLHLARAVVRHEAQSAAERLLHQMPPLLRRPRRELHGDWHAL